MFIVLGGVECRCRLEDEEAPLLLLIGHRSATKTTRTWTVTYSTKPNSPHLLPGNEEADDLRPHRRAARGR